MLQAAGAARTQQAPRIVAGTPAAAAHDVGAQAPSSALRDTWRDCALRWVHLAGIPPDAPVEPLASFPPRPPWSFQANVQFVYAGLKTSRRTDCPEVRRMAALEAMALLPPADVKAWTDGSAQHGISSGGAGVVLCVGNERWAWHVAAGALCSSFRAEATALLECLQFLHRHLLEHNNLLVREVRVCTDSAALLRALEAGPADQKHHLCQKIWQTLDDCSAEGRRFWLVWVPGHAGISGNDEADDQARRGGLLPQADSPLDFATATAAIRRAGRKEAKRQYAAVVPAHHHHRRATAGKPMPLLPGLSASEELAIRRLRVNRHPGCKATLARWRKEESPGQLVSPICGNCDTGMAEDAEHLLCVCPRWAEERSRILGPSPGLDILQSNIKGVGAFLREIGLLGPRI